MFTEFQLNQRGLSLLEMLVATAVLGVVTYMSMTLFSVNLRNQNHSRFKSQTENLHEEIRMILSDKEACTNTIGHQNLTSLIAMLSG